MIVSYDQTAINAWRLINNRSDHLSVIIHNFISIFWTNKPLFYQKKKKNQERKNMSILYKCIKV